jgi:microsomal dipeptidase-like Zn-dependent dipeptidase
MQGAALHRDLTVFDGLIVSNFNREIFQELRKGGVTAANCTCCIGRLRDTTGPVLDVTSTRGSMHEKGYRDLQRVIAFEYRRIAARVAAQSVPRVHSVVDRRLACRDLPSMV